MTSPAPGWFYVALYVMFWALRIQGVLRRGRQPLLRGRDWFFSTHVDAGFYERDGRRLLYAYWSRMLIPFALDIPWAIAIFRSGALTELTYLILAVSALIHVNHQMSVAIAGRAAKRFAVPESTQPVARVALSLAPRRLRDFTSVQFELSLAAVSLLAATLLVRCYVLAPDDRAFRTVFGAPLLMLYFQFGLLIIKRVLVGWRSAVPQQDADAHLEMMDERRRYYAKMCDGMRAAAVGSIAFWPLWLSAPEPLSQRLMAGWLGGLIVFSIGTAIWVEAKRKRIAALASRARPASLPELQHDSAARWPVCYDPAMPSLVLRGANGYSINLANQIAQHGVAYAAGFAALIFVLRMAA